MKTYTFRIKETFFDKHDNILRKPSDKTFTVTDENRANELKELSCVKLISDPKEKPMPPANRIVKSN